MGDGEEDRGVVVFDGAVLVDAEDAGVVRGFDRVGAKMAFGDELLPPAHSRVAVNAGAVEHTVFFYVVPAYFVRAFDAARGDGCTIVALGDVSN